MSIDKHVAFVMFLIVFIIASFVGFGGFAMSYYIFQLGSDVSIIVSGVISILVLIGVYIKF